ncbi:uncharacterized protein OCT59_026344 [Rhizophagus irregularis]|uniref:uncharacterized protein n=1 Tax=Rhizophagus irregularis TaxID=588596 RepID=UPI00331723AC|nr:hypothetical protein OCT59_026344 [Rhizophagus irregularis]
MTWQLSENYNDDYDYEFFHQQSLYTSYYVTCKLLPHSLIMHILNKEIYGIDFDVNELKYKYTLTWNQKLNLEQSLKNVLPFLQGKLLLRSIYHVILQDYHQSDDDDCDYEFFYQISNDIKHVRCKFLPSSSILSILNEKIYGIDFDVNDLKRKHKLTSQQKLNLELNLRSFLYIPEGEMRSDSDGNTISFQGNIESNATNGFNN